MSQSRCIYCGEAFASLDGDQACLECRLHESAESVRLAHTTTTGSAPATGHCHPVDKPHTRSDFQSTHWSLLLMAAQSDSPMALSALETLCGMYWYPVYAFIRRRGYAAEQAKDLTQDLFCHLLAKGSLAGVDPKRGRFRSFLLTCARNFLHQQWHRERTAKRGGGRTILPFDETLAETRYAAEKNGSFTPEEWFDRRWALNLLDQTMAHLRREYTETERGELFDLLQPFLSGARQASLSYAMVAARLGITENAARQAAVRMRQRYAEILRLEVAHTVGSTSEIEQELRHLRSVLSR